MAGPVLHPHTWYDPRKHYIGSFCGLGHHIGGICCRSGILPSYIQHTAYFQECALNHTSESILVWKDLSKALHSLRIPWKACTCVAFVCCPIVSLGITIQSTTLVASPILLAGGPLLAAWNGATCLVRRLSKLDSAKLSFSSPGREKIELLLSIGASRWEATREAITKAVKIASMPIINQMSVVGLVSIPGMMTGQILSGSDPSQVNFFYSDHVIAISPW